MYMKNGRFYQAIPKLNSNIINWGVVVLPISYPSLNNFLSSQSDNNMEVTAVVWHILRCYVFITEWVSIEQVEVPFGVLIRTKFVRDRITAYVEQLTCHWKTKIQNYCWLLYLIKNHFIKDISPLSQKPMTGIFQRIVPDISCSQNGEIQAYRSEWYFNNSLCEIILIHLSDVDHAFLRSYTKLQNIHFRFCKIYFVKQILVTWYCGPVFLYVLDTTSHRWCYFKHGLIEEFGSTNTVCWDNC